VAGAGHTLSVVFTPTDGVNYRPVTATVNIDVAKATPAVTWSNPTAIFYGAVLTGTQLNATAEVAGTFAYTPTVGTRLGAGAGQTLSVTFAPTDTANYQFREQDGSYRCSGSAHPRGVHADQRTDWVGRDADRHQLHRHERLVAVNGISAGFTVVSDTQITALVPPGTTTGRVRVTTPAGLATSETGFVVTDQHAVRALPVCYAAGYP